MSSNQTPAYGLNQWSLNDQVIMSEFNADNAKIEQALLDLKAALPKLQIGSYVGTGTYGADNPNTLTFDFTPKLVIVAPESSGLCIANMICIWGAAAALVGYDRNLHGANYDTMPITLTWSENSLSWNMYSAAAQLNVQNVVYRWIAIG